MDHEPIQQGADVYESYGSPEGEERQHAGLRDGHLHHHRNAHDLAIYCQHCESFAFTATSIPLANEEEEEEADEHRTNFYSNSTHNHHHHSSSSSSSSSLTIVDNYEKPYDMYKDSALRYLGYANELGEAFRQVIPFPLVALSYVLAIGYALGDTADKGYKEYRSASAAHPNTPRLCATVKASGVALETGIWQFLASVTLPAVAVNRTVHTTSILLKRVAANPNALRKIAVVGPILAEKVLTSKKVIRWLPAMCGLAIIPLMPHVVDVGVDSFMNYISKPVITKVVDLVITMPKFAPASPMLTSSE